MLDVCELFRHDVFRAPSLWTIICNFLRTRLFRREKLACGKHGNRAEMVVTDKSGPPNDKLDTADQKSCGGISVKLSLPYDGIIETENMKRRVKSKRAKEEGRMTALREVENEKKRESGTKGEERSARDVNGGSVIAVTDGENSVRVNEGTSNGNLDNEMNHGNDAISAILGVYNSENAIDMESKETKIENESVVIESKMSAKRPVDITERKDMTITDVDEALCNEGNRGEDGDDRNGGTEESRLVDIEDDEVEVEEYEEEEEEKEGGKDESQISLWKCLTVVRVEKHTYIAQDVSTDLNLNAWTGEQLEEEELMDFEYTGYAGKEVVKETVQKCMTYGSRCFYWNEFSRKIQV